MKVGVGVGRLFASSRFCLRGPRLPLLWVRGRARSRHVKPAPGVLVGRGPVCVVPWPAMAKSVGLLEDRAWQAGINRNDEAWAAAAKASCRCCARVHLHVRIPVEGGDEGGVDDPPHTPWAWGHLFEKREEGRPRHASSLQRFWPPPSMAGRPTSHSPLFRLPTHMRPPPPPPKQDEGLGAPVFALAASPPHLSRVAAVALPGGAHPSFDPPSAAAHPPHHPPPTTGTQSWPTSPASARS